MTGAVVVERLLSQTFVQGGRRVAVYARVSTTRQAEQDLSLPDQLSQAEAFSHGKGWRVVEQFIEAGASATDDRRPEFRS